MELAHAVQSLFAKATQDTPRFAKPTQGTPRFAKPTQGTPRFAKPTQGTQLVYKTSLPGWELEIVSQVLDGKLGAGFFAC